MEIDWEAELGGFLAELSATQQELLDFLVAKRERLAAGDDVGLAALQTRERELADRLQQCQQRRTGLLEQAAARGLPSSNLRSLSSAVPRAERKQLDAGMRQASARSRLLQHHSLTNWVLTQRTLLHLSQLLEIIGTGGRASPTYGKSAAQSAGGALVDRAA
jgi:hypothetical protein